MSGRTKRGPARQESCGHKAGSGRRGARGAILLEVVVATVLVALLVLPLAEGLRSAVERARSGRDGAGELSNQVSDRSKGGDPWSWGPRVVDGWWRPGPVLHLRVAQAAGDGDPMPLTLGIWADGWLIGERPAGATAALEVDQPVWEGKEAGELLVRLRATEGAWGPPWRTQVPGPDGGFPAAASAGPADLGVAGDSGGDPVVVVHMALLGTSTPSLRAGRGLIAPLFQGAPFPFAAGEGGWWSGEAEGRSQRWRMDQGRGLDVYF